MHCYHFLFMAGCWLMHCVHDTFESRPSHAAASHGAIHLLDLTFSQCRNVRRGYYKWKRCPSRNIPKAFCPLVRCPALTCLEKSFLKTEHEIKALRTSLRRPGSQVRVRKVNPGSKITVHQVKAKPPFNRRHPNTSKKKNNSQALLSKPTVTKRHISRGASMGCNNQLLIEYGDDVTIIDELTGNEYRLVSTECGSPHYQPVYTGGCEHDTCCNGDGNCYEVLHELPYLVWEGARSVVKWLNVILYCQCSNG